MQVKSIAEYSKESILQYFRPSLSYLLSKYKTFALSIFEWPLKTGFTVVLITIAVEFGIEHHSKPNKPHTGGMSESVLVVYIR